MITLTATEAQNRFNEILDSLTQEPVTITRQGRPPIAIVFSEEFAKFAAAQKRRNNAVLAFKNYMKEARGNINPAANQLTDEDINRLVHELR